MDRDLALEIAGRLIYFALGFVTCLFWLVVAKGIL